jgi:xanthine/CO dehydrogenase XdhC/CoxF family maturation factor
MKEIRTILKAYESLDPAQSEAALATVVRVEGSSYRRTGARMLVLPSGKYIGGISGGCLEGDALRRAQMAMSSRKASLITYDTTQEDGFQIGVGLGCQGIIDVLFSPLVYGGTDNPLPLLAAVQHTRIPRILVTITASSGSSQTIGRTFLLDNREQFIKEFPFREYASQVLEDIDQTATQGESRPAGYRVGAEELKVFIEILQPVRHLVIYGGNYDIYTMTRLAAELGWDVTVVTNPSKVDKSIFASATRVIHHKSEEKPVVDQYTAIMLMSHDYQTDLKNLQQVLRWPAGYIGMLGPRKRAEKIFSDLAEAGEPLDSADLDRIFAPAGLDIGANTPEEIALSILSEINARFAARQGAPLRLRESTIHEH